MRFLMLAVCGWLSRFVSSKSESKFLLGRTFPMFSSCAVSLARHHRLDSTRSILTSRRCSHWPISRASWRPSSLSKRCVEQSLTLKFSGSPTPGARAWRISRAYPFGFVPCS